MDFRTGRIRFPFRRFIRSFLFAEDAFGRKRLKYERRRIRMGIAFGVGLAGLVVWAGFAWQDSHRNHIGVSTEITWKGDDFDAINRDLDTSLHADRQSTFVLPGERDRDSQDDSGEVQKNVPMPLLVIDPQDRIVQAESTSSKYNGPNLLVMHSSKEAGKKGAQQDASPGRESTPSPSSGGAKLLGVIEDIPENEPTITSPGQKHKQQRPKTNEGPVIVPGQVMD